MYRPSSVRCLLLVVLATGLRAGETAPAATPPASDALAAARRDYEGISRTQASPELQKLEGNAPAATAQNLTLGAPATGRGNSLNGTSRAATPAKSANWLLEAMTEQKPSPLEELKTDASLGNQAGESKGSSIPSRAGEAVVNPLTSYMTEWMTPGDRELLKVKDTDAKASAVADGAGAEGAPDNFPRSDAAAGAGPLSPALGGLLPDARSNPYVTELGPGPGDSAKSPLAAPVAAPATPPLPGLPNDLAPVKTPGMPGDVLKAQDDAKYFPQLKRF